MADFGYDVSDYCDVDPVFGTLADLDELIADAHARDIKLILDWVPNHSSDQHPWFVESRSSRDNPKRDWYVWRDARCRPTTGCRSSRPSAPRGRFDETTEQYYLHCFMAEQPDLNWDNPEVEAAMHDVLRFWIDRGVDGLRLDAIHRSPRTRCCATTPAPRAATTRTGSRSTSACAASAGSSTNTTTG